MKIEFSSILDRFRGQEVSLLGNSAALSSQTVGPPGLLVTVNAGLAYTSPRGWRSDLHWVQDRRFMVIKSHLFNPFVESLSTLALSDEIFYPDASDELKIFRTRVLGNEGFSRHAEVGVFSGYSAVTGAMQILFSAGVSRINLFGVDQLYFSAMTRFYQASRGRDVDLHRAPDQAKSILEAIQHCRAAGIDVVIPENSALKRFKIVTNSPR